MTNGQSGDSHSVSESLFIKMMDNLTALSRNVGDQAQATHALKLEMDKLALSVTKVVEKMTTPPRHEEIYSMLQDISGDTEGKSTNIKAVVDTNALKMDALMQVFKHSMREMKIIFSTLGIAIIVAAIVSTGVNYYMDKRDNQSVAVIESLQQESKRFRQIIENYTKEVEALKQIVEKHDKEVRP